MTTSLHSGGPLVVLEDVHLTLGSAAGPVNILRGISLVIGAAETVSVVGPSGSGKSTLMMVLGGLERPSAGRVREQPSRLGASAGEAPAVCEDPSGLDQRDLERSARLGLPDDPTPSAPANDDRLLAEVLPAQPA